MMIRQKKGYCRSTDIAAKLGISRPSVSVELGKLIDQGLIRFDDEKLLHLTDRGNAIAELTCEKHDFFKRYLQSAGVDEETADREACAMEHAVSDASFYKIKAYLPLS